MKKYAKKFHDLHRPRGQSSQSKLLSSKLLDQCSPNFVRYLYMMKEYFLICYDLRGWPLSEAIGVKCTQNILITTNILLNNRVKISIACVLIGNLFIMSWFT